MRSVIFVTLATLLIWSAPLAAQDAKPEGGGDLRAKAQNPIASMYSVPIKFTADFGAPNGEAYFVNINPVIPATVGDWNLVSRLIIPALVSVDGLIEGTPDIPQGTEGNDRKTGIGDINYSLFFSPADSKGPIWGIGPSLSMPTASDDQLGSGKWSAGPTGVALWQPQWGTFGILGRQIWSFAGDGDRTHVNQLLIEPFCSYNLPNGWYLVTDMIITQNWNAPTSQRWTVPLGGGIGKLFTIGKQPINANLQSYYNVVKPDGAPNWNMSFTWSFLFPK